MRHSNLFIGLFFAAVLSLFFNKTLLKGYIPFPGDLLISEYNPWKTYSYLGYVPGSYPSKFQYFDVIRQIYPWKTFVISQIAKGQFPLWNPYSFSGAPLMANFQSAVFYPMNILYLIFPQVTVWTILAILQPLLSGIFTYMFCRKIGVGKIGSILSSTAFSYSLFMSVFLEYNTIGQVILWMPLLLYLSETILRKLNFWNLLIFPIILTASGFAGHFQIFGYVLGLLFIYIIARIISLDLKASNKIKYLSLFAFILFLSLGILAVQLIPSIELINLSARSSQEYGNLINNLLLQPKQLILFLSPDFFGNPATRNYILPDSYPGNALYIGIIPLVFALFGIPGAKKNYYVRFFGLFSVFMLIFLLRNPFTEAFYKLQIPLFSSSSPNNSIFILSFCLSILAGFGLDNWIKRWNNYHFRVIATLFLTFSFIWFGVLLMHWTASRNNLIFSTAVFLFSALLFILSISIRNKKNIFILLFMIMSVFDLFYYFQKFNPFVPKNLVFPKNDIFTYLENNSGINRIWGYGTAGIEANFQTQYSLFSPDGYDPLYPKIYGEFIQASGKGRVGKEFTNQTRSDAVLAGGYGESDLAQNTYRLKIMDVLGVKYILDRVENGSTEKTFSADRFKLIYQKEGWKVFENIYALPRIFLASDYKIYKNAIEFEKYFFAKDFDPSRTVLLEEGISGFINENSDAKGKVEILSYSPNKISLNVDNDDMKLLFISDTFYPGWHAFINGQETKIYKADYAFRTILLPKGNNQVTFEYNPYSFRIGLIVSVISMLMVVLLCLNIKKIAAIYEK